ncbi:MAG: helix-turn-helix domain-containing protein [Nitrospirota bacterium]
MDKRFIGIKDCAEYLDVSINTLRSWVWMKRIPYVKMGRLVKFDLGEIESWLKDKKIKEFA